MSTFGTGAARQRGSRASQLLLHWESRDGTLDARSGQVASYYSQVGAFDVGSTLTGRNGNAITGGHGMPRWEQLTAEGNIPRVAITADVSGKDVEWWEYFWARRVMAISLYVRIVSLYAKGSSVTGSPWALMLGNDPAGGGYIGIRRLTTTWQAIRLRGAANIATNFTEPGTITYPVDLLVTLSAAGQLSLYSRDSAATPVLQNGTTQPTDANMMIAGETWGGAKAIVGAGGKYRYESIKIARDVQTFATMDRLV